MTNQQSTVILVVTVFLCLALNAELNTKTKGDLMGQEEKIKALRKELNKYVDGYWILMEYWDSISHEEQQKVHERLKEIGL